MDREELARLILARQPTLRKQLIRQYINEDIVEDSLSYAIEKFMVNPGLWKPEKGSFNTYYFNVCSNYIKDIKRKGLQFINISEATHEPETASGEPFYQTTENYHAWLVRHFPAGRDSFIYDPEKDADPLAETKLTDVVKTFTPYNVDTLILADMETRQEDFKLDYRAVTNVRAKFLYHVRTKVTNGNPALHEWRKLIA